MVCIVVQAITVTHRTVHIVHRKEKRERGKEIISDSGRGTAAKSDDLGSRDPHGERRGPDLHMWAMRTHTRTRAHTHTHTTNMIGGAKGRWVSKKQTGNREPARFSPGVPGVQGGLWGQSDLGDPARKGSHNPSIRGIYS